MRNAFLEYSYSVIYSRALPDARDGLKPVQRRILFGMSELGLRPDRAHVKCQRVVGEVMGKYHPHGDQAIYDALVRMAQPFTMRLPLIDGHGNFGCLDDGPAAARYTEARMAPAALLMVGGLDEDTVDFIPNYDDTADPARGAARRLPEPARQRRQRDRRRDGHQHGAAQPRRGHRRGPAPHRQPDLLPRRPDEVRPRARPAGRRADHRPRRHPRRLPHRPRRLPHPRDGAGRRDQPAPQGASSSPSCPTSIGPEKVIEKIKDLVQSKRLLGIADVKDLTDRAHGMQLVIEVKNGFNPDAVLEQLYRLTPMEESFNINNVALVDGQPRTLGLKDLLKVYVDFRTDVVRRRTAVPAGPPRGAAAPRRGSAHRDPRHRRGHPADPRLRRRGHRAGPADGRVRPVRGAGDLHPRPAAAPAHQVLPDRAGDREGRARAADRGARGHPRRREAAAHARCRRSWPTWPRPTAPRGARCCWSPPVRPCPAPRAAHCRSRSPTTRAGCCSRRPGCSRGP